MACSAASRGSDLARTREYRSSFESDNIVWLYSKLHAVVRSDLFSLWLAHESGHSLSLDVLIMVDLIWAKIVVTRACPGQIRPVRGKRFMYTSWANSWIGCHPSWLIKVVE